MRYEYEAIRQALDAQKAHGVKRVTLHLTKGDTAWNPASTKDLVQGPTTVMYEEMLDGGVNAYIG